VSLQNLLCINIAKFGICKVQRSQQAVPGMGITPHAQHVFQSKLMLLAAMLAAPQCSRNCPWQRRTAAQQLWQEGFIRAGLPLPGIVSSSKPVPLPRWKYCPAEPSWNRALEPRRACAGQHGYEEVKVKSHICSIHRLFVEGSPCVSCYHKPRPSPGRCLGFMSVCRAFQIVSPFYQRQKGRRHFTKMSRN